MRVLPSETVLVYGRFKNVGKSRLAISKRQRTDLNVRFFSGAVVVHASPNIVGFLSLRGPSWNTAEKDARVCGFISRPGVSIFHEL